MSGSDEDVRLLSVAEAISDGTPVDWNEVAKRADPAYSAIVSQLQVLEELARLYEDTPTAWGPFSIVGEIARGAFGTVYTASDPSLGLTLALKVIRPRSPDVPLDPARVFNEARLLAKISHPNVVRVLRADRIGNEVGVAMELVKGRTLHDLVQTESSFGPNEAALIGIDLCRALAAVHRAGALHGDIKAHNVMRGEGGRTVLMDFGSAKDLNAAPRQPGNDFAGTPLYMAPEVFAGHQRSKTSDIYSLGVLLYYLVSGTYPVPGTTRTEVERHHREPHERKPLRDVRPDLPDPFIRVVERALLQQPHDRYQSAGEFEAALLSTLPVPAPLRDHSPWISWRIVVVAASVILAVGLGVATFYRSGQGTLSTPAAQPAANEAASPPVAVAGAPGNYRINAAFFREQNGADVRVDEGSRLALQDKLSLDVTVSKPVHVYVVNEDDRGESYLLFPLPDQIPTNPLPAGRHRLPGTLEGSKVFWEVTSTGGREHFVVIASPTSSPTFEKMFATLPRPTFNRPVARLTPDNLDVLRSVGGLALAPPSRDAQLRMTTGFGNPLTGRDETVSGVWIRQATMENPN
jgi:eukaryotic-like serine/threonine-protein kinase